MQETASTILSDLGRVEVERVRRAGDAALAAAVQQVKGYQQRRFERSYPDLLESPRYAAAARFFLEELYGARDFAARDAQFARVIPALVRLFPAEVIATVAMLARLHAGSERLDTMMGDALRGRVVDSATYVEAWRACGHPGARVEQIEATLGIGAELDRLTHRPMLRQALRMMRLPAQAAGLGTLQAFLERGFDTFRSMRGAREFLQRIGENERALASALSGDLVVADQSGWLAQLP